MKFEKWNIGKQRICVPPFRMVLILLLLGLSAAVVVPRTAYSLSSNDGSSMYDPVPSDGHSGGSLKDSPAMAPSVRKKPWRMFLSLQNGIVWWHAFEPPVVAKTFSTLGFGYEWFEVELGFGSPAWAKFRKKGFMELFLRIGFQSWRDDRFRLRHTGALGILFHNPPFGVHKSAGFYVCPVHIDFAVLDYHIGSGFWISLSPLTLSAVPRYHFSSSLALRYEIY